LKRDIKKGELSSPLLFLTDNNIYLLMV